MKSKFTLPIGNSNFKTWGVIFSIALMFIGFLCSRALSAIGIIGTGLFALWDIHPKQWLKSTNWLGALSWLLLLVLSGIWSNDKADWLQKIQVKLPLFLLPLAFDFTPKFSKIQLQWITRIMVVCLFSGILYSLQFYFLNRFHLNENYSISHLFRTPAYDDHISFSAAIALCIAWIGIVINQFENKFEKITLIISAIFFLFYLHLLASKTGLVMVYLLLMGILILNLYQRNFRNTLVIFILGFCLIYGSSHYLTSFRSRINYIMYDLQQYNSGDRSGNYNDGGRLMSYHIAIKSIEKNPLLGVGYGDVMNEMKKLYKIDFPNVKEAQILLPHNEFLMLFVGAGVFALLLFVLWFIQPIFKIKNHQLKYIYVLLLTVLSVPLMVDPLLEVQFGVWVFSFYLLFIRKTVLIDNILNKNDV